MSQGQFFVSTTNPNDTTGGGGCVCSPQKQIDCKPPYIIIPTNDLESIASPHVVVCQRCAEEMSVKLQGEALSAGERMDNQLTVDDVLRSQQLPVPVTATPDEDEDEPPEV